MRTKITTILLVVLGILGVLNVLHSTTDLFRSDDAVAEAEYTFEARNLEALPAPFNSADRMLAETFRVSSGQVLDVDVSHAEVRILAGESDEASVEVYLEARDMERARAYFEDMRFEIIQRDEAVRITTNRRRGNWSNNRNGGAHVLVLARVPRDFNLNIQTSHGDVALDALRGRINIVTSHGDVEGTVLTGAAVNIKTSHGDVEVDGLEAETVSVKTSHGDIELGTVVAQEFNAHTSHADIEVAHIKGRTDITNSHGDIEVHFDQAHDAYLRTSHGDIMISAASDLAADLNLKADRVSLPAAKAFDGTVEKDRAHGRLNGGGPRIEARTSHGSVSMRQ